MKTWVTILGFAAMSVAAHGHPVRAEGQLPSHVLYVGKTKTPRAEQFIGFFKKHFADVTVVDRERFQPKSTDDADVVVFDWSQSEGSLETTSIPFGRLEDWSKPTVLLNHSGLLVAGHWQLIGGAG